MNSYYISYIKYCIQFTNNAIDQDISIVCNCKQLHISSSLPESLRKRKLLMNVLARLALDFDPARYTHGDITRFPGKSDLFAFLLSLLYKCSRVCCTHGFSREKLRIPMWGPCTNDLPMQCVLRTGESLFSCSWFLLAFVWVGLGIFEIWAFWILIDTKPPNIMHFCGDLWGSSISSCRPRIVVARHCDACRFRAERRSIARRVIKKSIREMHIVASRGLASWIGVSFRSVCGSMHAPFSIPRNGGIGVACCRDLWDLVIDVAFSCKQSSCKFICYSHSNPSTVVLYVLLSPSLCIGLSIKTKTFKNNWCRSVLVFRSLQSKRCAKSPSAFVSLERHCKFLECHSKTL